MLQALDGFLMTLDHMGTVLFVSDDSGDYVGLTPVSNHGQLPFNCKPLLDY